MTNACNPVLAIFVVAAALLLTKARAAFEWRKVVTTGSYRGRGEAAFSSCGPASSLCLVGGRGPNLVDILDTSTLTWTSGSTNPLQMHHFQAIHGPDHCVWVLGAWTGPFPAEDTVDDIWKYCPQDDQWSLVAPIDRPRGAAGAVLHDGLIYLVSGNVGGHNVDAKLVPWFDVYDPIANKWSRLPDVPTPRDHFHAAVLDNKLYVVGGRDSTSEPAVFFDDVEPAVNVYDFATSVWTVLPDFPRPRGGTSAAVFDQTVYVAAGEGFGRAWAEVDVLQPDGSFIPSVDMPQPRHGTGLVACQNAMWIAAGVVIQGGGTPSDLTHVFYDPDNGPIPACSNVQRNPSSPSPLPTKTPRPVPVSPSVSVPASPDPSPLSSPVPGSPDPSPLASPSAVSTPAESTQPPPSGTSTPAESSSPQPSVASPSPTPLNSSGSDASPAPSNVTQSPTPSSNEVGDEGNDDSGPVCFPSDSTVQLQDGSTKPMSELRIGDMVKVGHPDHFSPVFFFSHSQQHARLSVVRITTATGETIALSPGHLLHSNGHLVAAGSVRVGDKVHVLSGLTRVSSISRRIAQGRHNPHTLHGDIVVDGVVASTFTKAVHPVLARGLLSPMRAFYRVFGAHHRLAAFNDAVLRALESPLVNHRLADSLSTGLAQGRPQETAARRPFV